LTGLQLNGLNEGSTYGDDAEMSTNYPIIRTITNLGVVSYARSFNWSSTGVATGSTPVSTNYSLTLGAGAGSRLVAAVANGIGSSQVLVVQGRPETTRSRSTPTASAPTPPSTAPP
jgi:hypothetical protein